MYECMVKWQDVFKPCQIYFNNLQKSATTPYTCSLEEGALNRSRRFLKMGCKGLNFRVKIFLTQCIDYNEGWTAIGIGWTCLWNYVKLFWNSLDNAPSSIVSYLEMKVEVEVGVHDIRSRFTPRITSSLLKKASMFMIQSESLLPVGPPMMKL